MEQNNNPNWIEEAFKKAQKEAQSADEKTDKVLDEFHRDLPHLFVSFSEAFGIGETLKVLPLLAQNECLVHPVTCAFISGYHSCEINKEDR